MRARKELPRSDTGRSRGSAVVEEMPEAYKDVADVVHVIERAGIARRVAAEVAS